LSSSFEFYPLTRVKDGADPLGTSTLSPPRFPSASLRSFSLPCPRVKELRSTQCCCQPRLDRLLLLSRLSLLLSPPPVCFPSLNCRLPQARPVWCCRFSRRPPAYSLQFPLPPRLLFFTTSEGSVSTALASIQEESTLSARREPLRPDFERFPLPEP